METIHKHIKIGTVQTYRGGYLPVWVTITYGPDRHNTGQTWPTLSMDGCIGKRAFGQIQDRFLDGSENIHTYALGWDDETFARLLAVWDRWHLNGLRAGTLAQEELVRQFRAEIGDGDYKALCANLAGAGLLIDAHDYGDGSGYWPYTYGHGWLFEPVPEDVVQFLASLPAGKNPPSYL